MLLKNPRYLKCYLIINDENIIDPLIWEKLKKLFNGEVTCCQIRIKSWKNWNLQKILKVKKLCKKNSIIFIINDFAKLCWLLNADGVHLGQSDLNQIKWHKFFNKHKILGMSASNAQELAECQKYAPNYLGIGAIYKTKTKSDAKIFNDFEALSNNHLPFVFIGGLNSQNIVALKKYKPDGYAYSKFLLKN